MTNPLAGLLADHSGRPRTVVSLLAAGAALAFAALSLAESFWALLCLQALAAAGLQALIPLGESRTLSAVRARGLDYGRIRLWGSLTFVIGVLGTGALLDVLPVTLLAWLLIGGLAATFLSGLALPQLAESESKRERGALRRLMADRPLRWFLFGAALLQASHAAYYAFSAIAWQAAGLGTFTIGWLWTEGVLAEIAFFAVSRRVLARVSLRGLLAIAALGGILRWSVTAATTDLAALAAVQLLHAATFAAAHLASVHMIAARAPGGLAATGQSLYSALSGGLAMGAMMLAVGPLYEALALKSFFVMAGVCAAALLLLAVAPRTSSD